MIKIVGFILYDLNGHGNFIVLVYPRLISLYTTRSMKPNDSEEVIPTIAIASIDLFKNLHRAPRILDIIISLWEQQ